MHNNLNKIINECVNNAILEAKIDVSRDNIVSNAQKRLVNYLKELVKNGNSSVISIMNTLGYSDTVNKQDMRKARETAFNGFNISNEFVNDILNVVNILKSYISENGNTNLEKIKKDYPKDFNMILRLKNFIDIKGLTYLYDKNANIPSRSYGIDWKNGGTENDLDFNVISDKDANTYRGDKNYTLEETKFLMKMRLVDQYMESKYGLSLEVPNISFSNGNAKLPDNVLIINFTSALNCPAWDECLVKHACYARAGEKQHVNVFRSNENRSLFWRATENDPKLLSLMMDFVRSYCFSYKEIAQHLIKNNLTKNKNINDLSLRLSRLPLTDKFFTPEIIEVMKQYRRIEYIRLNENGDFIGQWLVDAWEREAGIYKPFGIHVSAYTCRHLNYNGIKNLILNTSFVTGKNNIARHFIAIPEDVYNALDETYGGVNNTLIYDADSVEPNIQPLYSVIKGKYDINVTPNGKYYYKCPCGRKNGDYKISCYQCNLCYQPKASEDTLYVFVAAHGGSRENLNGYDLINCDIGVSQNFFKNYKGIPAIKEDSSNFNQKKLTIAKRNGINGVVNNTISSVYNHFKQLKNNISESKVIKLTEDKLRNIIKDIINDMR